MVTHLSDTARRCKGLLSRIHTQHEAMAERYNRGVRQQSFDKGELVFLHQKGTEKLEPRWRGPFRIHSRGDHDVSYCLG